MHLFSFAQGALAFRRDPHEVQEWFIQAGMVYPVSGGNTVIPRLAGLRGLSEKPQEYFDRTWQPGDA